MERIVDNLTVFRAKLGITQKDLADRIGSDKNKLNHIENK